MAIPPWHISNLQSPEKADASQSGLLVPLAGLTWGPSSGRAAIINPLSCSRRTPPHHVALGNFVAPKTHFPVPQAQLEGHSNRLLASDSPWNWIRVTIGRFESMGYPPRRKDMNDCAIQYKQEIRCCRVHHPPPRASFSSFSRLLSSLYAIFSA